MDSRSLISYFESKTTISRVTSETSVKFSAGLGMNQFRLKRRPAFHDKKWRQSVREWQEKATQNRKLALTDRYVQHILGYFVN